MPWQGAETINGGRIVYLRQSGELEFALERRLQIVGSHGSTVQVVGAGDRLRFSGNPTKFLQGHNLYGGNRLDLIFPMWAAAIADSLKAEPPDHDRDSWRLGDDVVLTRVDCTCMYRPTWAEPNWVPKWMSIACGVAHAGHQRTSNRGSYGASTLYIGQNSRRITCKLYDKAAEFGRHPASVVTRDTCPVDLHEYARDTLRWEVEVKSMELRERKLRTVSDWTVEKGQAISDERLAKLELSDGVVMTKDQFQGMPRRLRLPYFEWQAGLDLRNMYPRNTWYRYRRELRGYGVDILHVRPCLTSTEVSYPMGRPLRDYFSEGALGVPSDDPEVAALCGACHG